MQDQRQQLLEDARAHRGVPSAAAAAAKQRPPWWCVSGLPGSGKSYFCRRLASRYPIARLESDALRKALFGQPTHSPEESRRLFAACHHVLDRLLAAGIRRPPGRDQPARGAPPPALRHRRQARGEARAGAVCRRPRRWSKSGWRPAPAAADPEDLSDAGPEVYERMRSLSSSPSADRTSWWTPQPTSSRPSPPSCGRLRRASVSKRPLLVVRAHVNPDVLDEFEQWYQEVHLHQHAQDPRHRRRLPRPVAAVGPQLAGRLQVRRRGDGAEGLRQQGGGAGPHATGSAGSPT